MSYTGNQGGTVLFDSLKIKGTVLLIRLAEIKSGALELRSLCFGKEPSPRSQKFGEMKFNFQIPNNPNYGNSGKANSDIGQ